MRLSDEQIRVIREEAERAFGPDVEVRLFGSRVDDAARGGDIDLWIRTGLEAEAASAAEARFYAVLQRRLGEQRIGVVVMPAGASPRSIDRVALREGLAL